MFNIFEILRVDEPFRLLGYRWSLDVMHFCYLVDPRTSISGPLPASLEMNNMRPSWKMLIGAYHREQTNESKILGDAGPASWQYLTVRHAPVPIHSMRSHCRSSTASTGTVLTLLEGAFRYRSTEVGCD